MRTAKRIHSVTIKRMFYEPPDTSWLGEYANNPTSDYSIDRAHDLDCLCQSYNKPTGEGLRVLESAQQYLCDRLNELQETASQSEVLFDEVEWYDDGDTFIHDFLGEDEEFCLDSCRRSWDCREYRYFNPSSNYKDETPENTRKYVRQDYERMERLNAGDWCFVEIRAEAEYSIGKVHGDSYLLQNMSSGGLGGIESDSDKSYFAEIEAEELSQLRQQLAAIRFSQRAISAAFKTYSTRRSSPLVPLHLYSIRHRIGAVQSQ